MPRRAVPILLLALLAVPLGARGSAEGFRLTLIHVNDTHSRFDPGLTRLTLDLDAGLRAKAVDLELGGFPRVAEVISRMRAEAVHPLVLHGGDFIQGTLYFTKFQGGADIAFWNLVHPDAAVLGNHEFDKGPPLLRGTILGQARFPIVDANVDMTAEPLLREAAPAPWKVITVGGALVGVIGATTTETPYISSPGKTVAFRDPAASVQEAVDALRTAGVDKTVLVSHLGFDEDRKLAAKVRGLDVIVGGHSHTLLGNWRALGLPSFGPYPLSLRDASGGTTLIVQAWEWGKVVGNLAVDFDAAGNVTGSVARPVLVASTDLIQAYDMPDPAGTPVRVRWREEGGNGLDVSVFDGRDWKEAPVEALPHWKVLHGKVLAAIRARPEISLTAGDPAAWELTRAYSLEVQELRRTVVARVGEDLKRGFNSGPGPIVADAMRACTGARIGLTNAGGIRVDLPAGPLTTAGIYEVIPFGNTLVVCRATGAEVLRTFEDGIEYGLSKYGSPPGNPLLYVSGVTLSVTPANARGSRVSGVKVQGSDGSWEDLDPQAVYGLVVNNFMAAGGDRYDTLAALKDKMDTGLIDAEAFFAYVKDKTLSNAEARIRLIR